MSARFGRRTALFGGATGLASLLLGHPLRGDPRPGPLPRLVLVMQNNGTQQKNYWPASTGPFTSPILEPLLRDPVIAQKCRFVKGVSVPIDVNGTDGNEHDIGFARMFTGAKLLSVGGHPFGGARSVDQTVARAFRDDSLALAVLASSVEPFPKVGFDHRRSFSYVAPGVQNLPFVDMVQAYERLFAPPLALGSDVRARLLTKKSALDASLGDLARLRGRIPESEREKLDRHAESIRDVERGLTRDLEGRAKVGATSVYRPEKPTNFASDPAALITHEGAIPELVATAMDLTVAAIASSASRVCTVQLGYGGGKWKFGWEGYDVDLHGEVAHRDTGDAGSTAQNTAHLVKANRWYATQIARLVSKLDAIPENDGTTALDHTLVVWANEFGRGDHSLENVPIALIGGGALTGLGRGGRTIDVGVQPFQRLGCTILRAMGIHARGFGDLPECGPFVGL